MGENVRGIMDDNSGQCMAPVLHHPNYDANVDYVINEYMDRLGTRINILETELKYAWRALDLLSQEYIKMWERLEKLEGLLYEQQSVISQLLNFYTTGGCPPGRGMPPGASAMLESRLGELEVIREILGNGTVEDGLEEGLDVTRSGQVSVQELEEMHPDEAFYRSLNQAYREDLDPSQSSNQLGMIWEEGEDGDDTDKKLEINEIEESLRLEQSQEIYSAMDYKDYRGNSPCVSEQDIAQLSRIDSIDHVAIEKLNELDRLSSKLRQDSANIKHLQRKLLESPLSMSGINEEAIESKQALDNRSIDDQIRQIYSENENWSFSSNVRDQDDLLMLAKADLNSLSNYSSTTRPNSRLSVSESVMGTDNEVAEVLAGGKRTPTSPRRRGLEVTTCNAPFTTVTGRLAYSAAVQNVESAEAAAAAAAAAQNSKNPFYCSSSELNSLIAASYETVPCSTPNIFSIKSEKAPSPTLSICSIRTRQDGYIGNNETPKDVSTINQSPSPPPPPAPRDMVESYLLPNSALNVMSTQAGPSQVFLAASDAAASSSINTDHGRLSPKSPKSPRTSPKRSKSRTSNIVAAKSDSGLSSMSGWSSLEKSPGSPKNGPAKATLNYYSDIRNLNNRPISPAVSQSIMINSRPFTESSVDSRISEGGVILPGGHPLSAFTSVKSPCSLETSEGYGTFVPAPAPASDINVSPRRKSKHAHQQQQQQLQNRNSASDYLFKNDQSAAIYSVAGSNKDSYTTVYTSNSADYINQTINYPDLVEPYENNEFFNAQQRHFYNTTTPAIDATAQRRRSLTRSYSTSKGPETLANHEGYKTAMYRTMFPTGNITDALSYYPTSSRYDSAMANVPPQDYNDPSAWLNCPPEAQFVDSASTSSSMRSAETSDTGYTQSPYMDSRRQYQNIPQQQQHQQQQQQQQQQPIYENQQQIDQHKRMWNQRQEIPYLELDLRNRNVPEYVVQQQIHSQNKYYDPNSGVVMTQAGYITIPGQNEHSTSQEKSKKLKRGNTLKSAMNSVSNWLPEFNLTKRHRSYSLPGVKRDDVEKTKSYAKSNAGPRKKKRHNIVSTVSGILQKAKKKTGMHGYTQSLSDPEQSDNEWVMQRTGSVVSEDDRSEDNFSMYSESVMERDLFAKISKPKATKANGQENHVKVNDEDRQLQTLFEPIKVSPQHSDRTSKAGSDNGLNIEEEFSGKSTGSGSSNIFQTMGETKRSSGSSEKSDETIITESKMVVVVGGASMEFAVSRALGKYRQRQSSSISDDQLTTDDQGVTIEEIVEEEPKPQPTIPAPPPPPTTTTSSAPIPIEKLPEQKSTESHASELSKSFSNEEPPPVAHGSPSSASLKSHLGRYMPKHQQSLEIPGHRGDDEDNRSTHSWKSTSRVSSRRQSTEDSIDSEDEWYCYELRKLEEMERQTQLEVDMGATLQEEPEPEEDEQYEPYEEVKEKMSFVLRELRMKAKVVEGVLDEKDNNLHVIQSANRRGSNRGSFQLDNAASLFEKVKIHRDDEEMMMQELEMIEQEMKEDKEKYEARQEDQNARLDVPKVEDEHSSGDTSGPDSPHHSTDEYDETEMAINEEFARCYISKEEKEAEELKASVEATANASQAKEEAIPKIQVDTSTPKDEPPKEGGPLGSKWKLLKTLKERKAEEKNSQKTTEQTPADKVSMLGMMQKFYEIHVKT